ncbi:MAG: sigma-70 family RNA polymerase sigma factor [Planctomycetes bacterium]|nr:sigma-70 family RNA polymerase sigma factor [Planctomycetota bacterium]
MTQPGEAQPGDVQPPRSMDELMAEMYTTLREIAERALGRGKGLTCDATDLVHECYIKLSQVSAYQGLPRVEFVALAATVIRNELVDRARRRSAKKRGGDLARVTLHDQAAMGQDAPLDLLDLDEALKKLATLDPRQARIVELRFFGGLSNEEAAEILAVKPRLVADEWAMARAWLKRELSRGLGS